MNKLRTYHRIIFVWSMVHFDKIDLDSPSSTQDLVIPDKRDCLVHRGLSVLRDGRPETRSYGSTSLQE